MALISSTQAVKFANEKGRLFANHLKTMHRTVDQFMLDIVDFESATGANASGDTIDDGAAYDGRTIITKNDVAALKYVVEQLKACMETSDRKAVVNKMANLGVPLY